MKVSKYLALPLTYAIFLVLIANEAEAKASATQQVEDMTQWTKDQVQSYFDKYSIYYDKQDENILETAKRYRDSAMNNANIFITDKKDSVTRLIEELKIKIAKQYNMASTDVDRFMTDLSHELKQLEISGQLNQDKVKQALDQYQSKAIKQKYVTEAQWKQISNDIQHSFSQPTWYQRIFHSGPSHSKFFDQDAFQNWITTTITDRVRENKELTEREVKDVVDTLQRSIQTTSSSIQDLSKLGSADWWKQFGDELEKEAKIKKYQTESIIASLKDDMNAYKIFAMDYAGETAEQTQSFIAAATQYIMDKGNDIYQAVVHPLKSHSEHAKQSVTDSAASVTDAAASMTDAASSSVSSFSARATDTMDDAKDYVMDSANSAKEYMSESANDFGKFWRQKELDTYRKVGYTEAHINWMENYLSRTFYDKTHIAKDTVQHAIQTIRNYLIQAKIQTVSSIDTQLKSLEVLIDHWRKAAVRDEL